MEMRTLAATGRRITRLRYERSFSFHLTTDEIELFVFILLQSKGGILAKACEYIGELRSANQGLGQCLRDNDKLRHEINALKQLVAQLKRENSQLRTQITSPAPSSDVVHLSP